jgi:hypothetical protein
VSSLRKGEPFALGVCLGVALLFFSKVADGVRRVLPGVSASIGETGVQHLKSLEEILELGAPILFIIAILAYHRGAEVGPGGEA